MRDLLLLIALLSALGIAIRYPFVGLLTWAWFTIMTPHQLAYGVYGIPINVLIAGVTVAGYILSGEVRKFKFDPITILLLAFAGWLTIAQFASLRPDDSFQYYDRFIKTLVFVLLCAQMIDTKARFNAMVWTLVVGMGYFAAKAAVFTLATLGQYRAQGFPDTVLGDNNHFGIAMATILPLILYARSQAARPIIRTGLLVLLGMTILTIIGTHSRGGFLALLVFGGFMWLQSKRKVMIASGLALAMIPAIAFMPAKWTERMSTIGEATQDASFMGRVDAWVINAKLAAKYPLTGAGLRNGYNEEIAATVDTKRAKSAKAAHSIYFEVLGGAGIVGLLIYLGIFATAILECWRLERHHANKGAHPWKGQFAYYAQISIFVFAAGGASVSMEMWDGYLMVIALVAALSHMTLGNVKERGYALKEFARTKRSALARPDAPLGERA